jgi:hypothetical protein
MALSHNVISAKRQCRAAKRAVVRKNLATYKRQMVALWKKDPIAFATAVKEFPRGGKK